MNPTSTLSGFRKIIRRNGLFQEHIHDAYKARGKLKEPSACACGAVYIKGRWQWLEAPEGAYQTVCPACHRTRDHFPSGFLSMKGEFFREHHDEIMCLVRNHEQRERQEHPLKRIMAVEESGGSTLVTTTDLHLARGLGEALQRAYKGKLEFYYNEGQNLLRVFWSH